VNKIKLGTALLLAAGLFLTVQTGLPATKPAGSSGVDEKAVSFGQLSKNGYVLVTGVADQFGGMCASVDSFRLKVTSGGQSTAVGESDPGSSQYWILPGYANSAAVLHGDCDANGEVTMGDMVYLINYLYQQGPAPIPMEAGDVNCSGLINQGDIVYIQNYLFKNGPPPCGDPNV
jgi:hypothetical protein